MSVVTQSPYSLNLGWLSSDIEKKITEVFGEYTKSVHENLVSRNGEMAKNLDSIIKRTNYQVDPDNIIKTYMDRLKDINSIVGYLGSLAYMISVLGEQSRTVYGQQRRIMDEERSKLISIFKHLLAIRNNIDVDSLSDKTVQEEILHYASLYRGLAEDSKERLKEDYLRKGGDISRMEDIYELGEALASLYGRLMDDSIISFYDKLLTDGYIGPKLIAKVVANIIKQNPDMIYNFSSKAFRDLYSKYVIPSTTPVQSIQQQGQQNTQQQNQSQQSQGSQQAQGQQMSQLQNQSQQAQ